MQPLIEAITVSKTQLWIGRILSALAVLFLIFDGAMKAIKEPHVMAASVQVGFPPGTIAGIGITLLVCTAIYAIPRTSVFGAMLLTGYLGGAVACGVRASRTPFEILFPVIFATFVWAGIFLREGRLRTLVPLRR